MTVALLALPDTLTMATATQALRGLEPALAGSGGAQVEVDATALRDYDSAALAVLLQLRRNVQAAGGDLCIKGAPKLLAELAQLYGVDGALPGLEEQAAA
ncbi:STAS domain-containing protein [Azohydromonas lata]|uniref:STAS domain-containing protein n=1 Tax=Azohydromonas lata TaxID=45677 RepID=A0ABU5IBT3_9BURK|nr:STAS domain-containing protein [Azohydromonas lata]MDZ5455433.1 STAS domain-containing protein [Azohydromonas lata]